MNVPIATVIETEGDYADSRIHTLEGHEGFWRRLKPKCAKQKGVVLACYDRQGFRTAPFRLFAADVPVEKLKAV